MRIEEVDEDMAIPVHEAMTLCEEMGKVSLLFPNVDGHLYCLNSTSCKEATLHNYFQKLDT